MTTNTKLIPDNKDFSSHFHEECTLARLEDESLKSFLTSEKNQRYYYAQAEFYLRRINVYKPLLIFELHTEDIPKGLVKELQSLDKVTRDKIITNAVRRIYESVDPEYFHRNGIYGKVKWRFGRSKR